MPDLLAALPDRPVVLAHALREGRLLFRERAALERYAARQAHEHLRWVAAHSPYTASRFLEAGLPLRAWRELPPVGKAEMIAHFDTLNTAGLHLEEVRRAALRAEESRDFSPEVVTPAGRFTVGLSTGTSGTRGVFVVGRAERLAWAGVMLRRLLPRWPLGLLRPARVAFVLRAEGGLYRSVQGRHLSFHFLDLLRPVPELARELTELAPTLLVGPPSVLRALLEAGALARPERVVSVAEVLDPDDRRALSAGFGPVTEVYQATEGLLGLPCAHGSLHLNEAHVHFDFEDLGNGRVRPVVTDLRRRVQPLIRHRLDDVLVLDTPCPCGLAARRVAHIAGRQDDALRLPARAGGQVTVWPDFLRGALDRVPGLREYRAEQTGPGTLALALDPDGPEVRAAAAAELRRALARSGAAEPELAFKPLPPRAAGTKRRRVVRTWQDEGGGAS
ncbi:F390 synthetase-related protein [uncultured Deinococcus sp.]|uniref:F390 synthetase-related protein n=1 Tax=uncultured Deinococcus sp. TaxID=158789 RepID=UPI002585AFA0|nr:F390 synthetase-related protein [uncultured Deinococcus sp.]